MKIIILALVALSVSTPAFAQRCKGGGGTSSIQNSKKQFAHHPYVQVAQRCKGGSCSS